MLIIARNRTYGQILYNLLDWNSFSIDHPQIILPNAARLSAIAGTPPQIVLFDAASSPSDCLTLLYQIRAQWPSVRILLISSTQDFNFSRAAFDLKIDALLLWSELSDMMLGDRITQVISVLDEEIHRKGIVKRQLFREILKGKKPSIGETEKYFEIRSKNARYVLISINRDTPHPVLEEDAIPPTGYYSVNWHGTKLPSIFSYVATVNTDMHSWCTLLMVKNMPSTSQLHYLTRTAAIALQQSFKQQMHDTVSLVFSKPFHDFSLVPSLYTQLQSIHALQHYYSREQVHTIDDFPAPKKFQASSLDPYLLQLGRSLENNDHEECISAITAVFQYLKTNFIDPNAIPLVCKMLSSCLISFCQKKNISFSSICQARNYSSLCYSTDEVSLFFCQLCTSLLESPSTIAYSGKSQKINQAISHMEKNFGSIHSVSDLAAHLHISSDYLRHLFKSETGENISVFITRTKIEKAKVLLRTGQFKISEVAEMVGFTSTQYFSSVFKKFVGCNPRTFLADLVDNDFS